MTRARLAGLALALSVIPAAAQEEPRMRASVGAAATTGVGSQYPAWTASFGYRFAERLSFDADFTHAEREFSTGWDVPIAYPAAGIPARLANTGIRTSVPGAIGSGPAGPGNVAGLTIPARLGDIDSSTSIVTIGVRYELPITGGRLRPYLAGGLGLARTDVDFEYPQAWLAAISSPGFPGNTLPALPTVYSSETRTNAVVSGGFGASIRVFKGISADVDVRYFRFDNSDMTRLGGGVSYRF
jgi:opacity protein-like surface antigen